MTRVPRVVTLGGATRDIFLSVRGIEESQKQVTNEDSFVFPLGEKVEVGSLVFDIGGGAANVAVSLARPGLHAAYLGKLGADRAGDEICDLLTAEGVTISGAIRDPKVKTNLSTVLLAESGERSILTFRGATSHLKRSEIDPSWIEGSWLYVTSLAGKLSTLEWVVKLANTKGIRIALDPGKGEMADSERFLKLLPKIQLLKANRAELALLSGDDDLERSVMTLHEFGCDVVGTDGAQGSFAAWSDGRVCA